MKPLIYDINDETAFNGDPTCGHTIPDMPNKVSITETDPADLIGAEELCPKKGANFSSASDYFSTGIMSCNMTPLPSR